MLVSLQVRDFAIIDKINVDFDAGMTVLTGETGAGKSILVDALGLVLGERGSAQLVRSGAKRAEFSAEFDVASVPAAREWLAEQSLDEDDACLLRRVVNADGRSRAFINGNAATIQQLKTIGEFLVDIHGQHFHQSLGHRRVQRQLLDHFGELDERRGTVGEAWRKWRDLDHRRQRLRDAETDRASRIDLLSFQLEELESLAPTEGEYEQLQTERQRLANSGRLVEGVVAALDALYDGDATNANKQIADAARHVDALVGVDEQLADVAQLMESAAIQVAEASDTLRRYADAIDMDPAHRDTVEERLDAMQAIARKHRVEANELAGLRDRLAAELDELVNAEQRGRELDEQVQAAQDRFVDLATALSKKRRAAARRFATAVTEAMHGLGMPGGSFEIEIDQVGVDAARAHGVDAIEFLISANAGQPLMPLAKVASGGELSRMGLAIQVIASDGSAIPTMVFDEVDAGVGGGVAEMVGRRLAELGESRQVLCVTHLPQVASLARQHLRVAKVSDGKSTRTSIQSLDKQERIDELARMLGGVEITSKTLEHAAEMLAGAPKKRA